MRNPRPTCVKIWPCMTKPSFHLQASLSTWCSWRHTCRSHHHHWGVRILIGLNHWLSSWVSRYLFVGLSPACGAPFWPLSQHCSIVPAECRGLDYRETGAVLVCSVPELTRGLRLLVMISIRTGRISSLWTYPPVTSLITLCFFSLLFYSSLLSARLAAPQRWLLWDATRTALFMCKLYSFEALWFNSQLYTEQSALNIHDLIMHASYTPIK